MDEEDFAEEMYALTSRFKDRISEPYFGYMVQFAEVGEWNMEMQELIASLKEDRTPVTIQEREHLRTLLEYMNKPTSDLDELIIIDGSGEDTKSSHEHNS